MSSELTHNPGQFDEVIHIIDNARSRAMKAVNAELIQMYWSVGAYLSELCSASSFGDKIIDEVAAYIAQENPNIKGFNRRGLYRMKQFYETYKDDEFVTPLVTQISWTNHLLIMSGSKTADERHFFLSLLHKLPPLLCSVYFSHLYDFCHLTFLPFSRKTYPEFFDAWVDFRIPFSFLPAVPLLSAYVHCSSFVVHPGTL